MKLTREIIDLIHKREEYGKQLNSYDSQVQEWCKKHQIDDTSLLTEFGCMVLSEPTAYAELTIKLIEKK